MRLLLAATTFLFSFTIYSQVTTTTYYPNGDVVENAGAQTDTIYPCGNWMGIGRVVNGKKEGYWRYTMKDGYPMYSGTYRNGMKEGVWNMDSRGGKLNYKNNLLEGEVIYYHLNTTIIEEKRKYHEGKAHGDWFVFDEEGKAIEIRHYVNGVPVGLWEIQQGYITWKGPVNEFGYHGKWQVTSHDTLIGGGTYINGKQEGDWIEVHDRYQYSMGKYTSGKKQGQWKSYFNKQPVSSTGYKDGRKYGLDTSWSKGYIRSVFCWYADDESGPCFTYFPDGRKETECVYDRVTRGSEYSEYNENGKMIARGKMMKNPVYWAVQSQRKKFCPVPVPADYEFELMERGLCSFSCVSMGHEQPTVTIDSIANYLRSEQYRKDTAGPHLPPGTPHYVRCGVWTFYHASTGKRKEEGEYLPEVKGNFLLGEYIPVKTGWWRVYGEQGNLLREELYENGALMETRERTK